MKTQNSRMILAAGFTALLAASPALLADEPDAVPPLPPPSEEAAPTPPRPEGAGHAAMPQRRLRQTADELKKMYDADHDGTLSPSEKETMASDMAVAERLQRFVFSWKLVKEVDADGDLTISDEEAAAIPAAMEKMRSEFNPGRGWRREEGGDRGGRRGPPPEGFRRGPRPEDANAVPGDHQRPPREGRIRRRGPPPAPAPDGGDAPASAEE